MFGMGIFEILVVLIVAVIFLGPEKLPQAMVDIAKFFKAVKKTINDAKDTFDKELQIDEIKKEAFEYKNSFTSGLENMTKDIQLKEVNEILPPQTQTYVESAHNPTQKKRQKKTKSLPHTEEKSSQTAQDVATTKQIQTNKPDSISLNQHIIQPKVGKPAGFKKPEKSLHQQSLESSKKSVPKAKKSKE